MAEKTYLQAISDGLRQEMRRDDRIFLIGEDVKRLLSESMRRAEESPLPDPSTLLEGVYAEPEELDTPHHR